MEDQDETTTAMTVGLEGLHIRDHLHHHEGREDHQHIHGHHHGHPQGNVVSQPEVHPGDDAVVPVTAPTAVTVEARVAPEAVLGAEVLTGIDVVVEGDVVMHSHSLLLIRRINVFSRSFVVPPQMTSMDFENDILSLACSNIT